MCSIDTERTRGVAVPKGRHNQCWSGFWLYFFRGSLSNRHVHSLHICTHLSDIDNSKEEVWADLRVSALGYWHNGPH